jgi:hypothetical protein
LTQLTREQALEIYFRDPDARPPFTGSGDDKPIPSADLTTCTDADDGWHVRNDDEWLATIHDDGRIVSSGQDDHADPDLNAERVRGTRSERRDEGALTEAKRDLSGRRRLLPSDTLLKLIHEQAGTEPINAKASNRKNPTIKSLDLEDDLRAIDPTYDEAMTLGKRGPGARRPIPDLTPRDLKARAAWHREQAAAKEWIQLHRGGKWPVDDRPLDRESWRWFETEARRRRHLHIAEGLEALAARMESQSGYAR